jgi:uncharacterized protein (TIGR02099 family)
MDNPEPQAADAPLPLAERWRRLRAAYRYANLASHHLLGFAVKLVLLLYFGFALVFLAVRYAVLPNIDYYKGDIERIASRALGNQVSIARIYATWHGLHPSLFLGDVVLRDRQGRTVLALPSVAATISWWSLPAREARFESLEVIRPALDVRRSAGGELYVAGVRIEPSTPGQRGGPDWLFRQHQIVVRDGNVHWTDELRGAPPLALSGVSMVFQKRWNGHQFAFKATPPAALGQPLDVRARFTHPRFGAAPSDIAQWKGELYADMRDTDLAGWKQYVDYPFSLTQGKGSVRAWVSVDHARLAGFTADVRLAGVSARLAPKLPPLELARVSGRVSAREDLVPGTEGKPSFGANGHAISLTDFAVVTRDGRALPAATFSESFRPAAPGRPQRVEIKGRQVDLAALAEVAAQLPLAPDQRSLLAALAPRGQLLDFSAEWQGKYPQLAGYRIQGRVAGLSLKPQPARAGRAASAGAPALPARVALPGFDKLTGSIDASERGGSVVLDSDGLVLQLPNWFAEPALPFDRMALRARWSYPAQQQLLVEVDGMEFVQDGLAGSVSGRHLMSLAPGKGPGTADFSGTLDRFEIKRIGRYLPLQTPPGLRDWLTGALQGGVLHGAHLRLRGDLAEFPFRAAPGTHPRGVRAPGSPAPGEFRVAGRIQGGKLNYTPAHLAADGKSPLWPLAEEIDGSIVFDRTRMEIRGERARTQGVALTDVKAVVPDLLSHDRQLEIEGMGSGPLQDFLRYMGSSPVLGWTGRFTEQAQAAGPAKLWLKLQLPLARLPESKVQGVLQLQGNELTLFPELPPLQAALGKIEFTERGVNLSGVGASFMGGPLALTGGTQRDGAIAIRLGGTLSADGMRKTWPAPAMQRLASHFSGSTRFTGAVVVKDHRTTVTLDSSLAGLGLEFPAPLNKPAPDALPLRFTLAAGPAGETGVARDEIRIALGTGINARYLREKQGAGPWVVQRGGIGVNAPAPEPDSGMMINVNMKSLNLDRWLALGRDIGGAKAEPAAAAAGVAAAGLAAPDPVRPAQGAPNLAQYIVPDVIAARSAELIVAERKLGDVVVGASHQKDSWQASIDSRQLSGHVMWNESSSGQGLGKVTARLATLYIPESAAAEVKDLLESGSGATATIPALDIVAERFQLFNKQFGRLELFASNAQALAGREWRIDRLSLVNPDGQLKATGRWLTRDGKSNTGLNFTLDIADAGRLLDRLGFPETLRRGKGKLSGDISWSGVPYALDIPSLSGQIQMNVESGQFLKQDPGAAKLLGVLSLQMLPRMLTLDFKDIFSEGLAFDGISANAIINRGVVKTDNLKMHGVAATVLMDGTADIANETANLHVVVIPEFNLGTGPLVYGLAVNPIIGLGSYLAQLFLRAPVMKALTYQMQITGPWKAPVIHKLERGTRPVPPPAPPKGK